MGLCEIRANLLKNGECPTRRLLAIHQSNYSQMQQQQNAILHNMNKLIKYKISNAEKTIDSNRKIATSFESQCSNENFPEQLLYSI